jgi:1-acyl-sn-glycerol-3-phosphate acyltransferase
MPTVRWLSYMWLRLVGWQFEGPAPTARKFIAVGAPHTSNWDFIVFLAILWHFRLKAHYLGKHSLFWWPLGILMRRLGGIPVRRDRADGLVDAAVAAMSAADSMILVIAPESTRRPTAHWKSGFYRIALAADVPILPAFVDHADRRAGVGEMIRPTGDVAVDMGHIRAFFTDALGDRHPRLGSIRLREEDGAAGT